MITTDSSLYIVNYLLPPLEDRAGTRISVITITFLAYLPRAEYTCDQRPCYFAAYRDFHRVLCFTWQICASVVCPCCCLARVISLASLRARETTAK